MFNLGCCVYHWMCCSLTFSVAVFRQVIRWFPFVLRISVWLVCESVNESALLYPVSIMCEDYKMNLIWKLSFHRGWREQRAEGTRTFMTLPDTSLLLWSIHLNNLHPTSWTIEKKKKNPLGNRSTITPQDNRNSKAFCEARRVRYILNKCAVQVLLSSLLSFPERIMTRDKCLG